MKKYTNKLITAVSMITALSSPRILTMLKIIILLCSTFTFSMSAHAVNIYKTPAELVSALEKEFQFEAYSCISRAKGYRTRNDESGKYLVEFQIFCDGSRVFIGAVDYTATTSSFNDVISARIALGGVAKVFNIRNLFLNKEESNILYTTHYYVERVRRFKA